ncbi:trimethylamine-N-oxide reductase cytochrome c-type subunit TorC [Desulfitispora alkaliphila]|uniref:cytochrome c3 family protein n=1 Tax=Desulfitispora alkaliphila TaxID=622674 RepID=UPI003D263EF6
MKYKIITVIGVLGLMVLGVAGFHFTSQPSFCSNCHSISPLVDSWENSVHQNVSCMACHAEPGFTGAVERKANGLRELYVHVTNPEAVPQAQSDTWEFSQRCLDCHEDVQEQSPLSHNQKHFDLEIPCVTCHEGVDHPEPGESGKATRESCVQCHGTTFQ